MDPRVKPQSDPLLASLLQLRSEAWIDNFDIEKEKRLGEDDIKFMIEAVCMG